MSSLSFAAAGSVSRIWTMWTPVDNQTEGALKRFLLGSDDRKGLQLHAHEDSLVGVPVRRVQRPRPPVGGRDFELELRVPARAAPVRGPLQQPAGDALAAHGGRDPHVVDEAERHGAEHRGCGPDDRVAEDFPRRPLRDEDRVLRRIDHLLRVWPEVGLQPRAIETLSLPLRDVVPHGPHRLPPNEIVVPAPPLANPDVHPPPPSPAPFAKMITTGHLLYALVRLERRVALP